MGAAVKIDEPVTYFEWTGGEHEIHEATVRVFPGNPGNAQHAKAHLIVTDESDGSTRNINNVDNEEVAAPDGYTAGVSFYRRRFHDWGD